MGKDVIVFFKDCEEEVLELIWLVDEGLVVLFMVIVEVIGCYIEFKEIFICFVVCYGSLEIVEVLLVFFKSVDLDGIIVDDILFYIVCFMGN